MTVDELINLLQDFDPEAEVRIAIQPNDPVESEIEDAVDGKELGNNGIVYLVEGDNMGDAPLDLWSLV
jgi:hypothetical protein